MFYDRDIMQVEKLLIKVNLKIKGITEKSYVDILNDAKKNLYS